MLKTKKINILVCLIFSFFFICLMKNFTVQTADYGDKNFDPWSENIMIADLNYYKYFNKNSSFLKAICPGYIVNDGYVIRDANEIYFTHIKNEHYKEEDYKEYTSNLVLHRYFYHFVSDIITNNETLISVLHAINAALLALVFTILILWIKKYTNWAVAISSGIIWMLFCPNLVMYGKNLYWAAWSLFIPMIGSIWEVGRIEKRKKINLLEIIVVACLTCFIKQLFYFEFLPTTMIAMVIPYCFYFLLSERTQLSEKNQNYDIKEIIKILVFLVIGAVSSFCLASAIKVYLLIGESNSLKDAILQYVGPIVYRLIGDTSSTDITVLESTQSTFRDVFSLMLEKPFISIKKFLFLSQGGAICIYFLLFMIRIVNRKKETIIGIKKRRYDAWIFILMLGLLAPCSWFILAKPHTYVHNWHCSFIWYLPFSLLLLVFFVYIIYLPLENIINKCKKEIPLIWKRYKKILISVILVLLLMPISNFVWNYKYDKQDIQKIKENAIEYNLNSINGKLYYTKGSLCIEIPSFQQTQETFFVHVYTYKSGNEFENRDFYFLDKKVGIPIIDKKKIAILEITDEPINRIVLGQYNQITGERTWEEQIFLSEEYSQITKIEVLDITNENWNNGLSIDGRTLCIDNVREEYLNLIGKKVLIQNDMENTIENIIFQDERYTHIILKDRMNRQKIKEGSIDIEIIN